MATNEPRTPPTTCDVAATLRAAATALATAASNIESCTGHPLFADVELGIVHNARRVTRVAQGTVDQAAKQLSERLDAINHMAGNVA